MNINYNLINFLNISDSFRRSENFKPIKITSKGWALYYFNGFDIFYGVNNYIFVNIKKL